MFRCENVLNIRWSYSIFETLFLIQKVSYEDAMISGLLSTLNEEAQEDVLNEAESSDNLSLNESLENIDRSLEIVSVLQSF